MKNELNVFFHEHALVSYTGDLTRALSAIGVNVNLVTMNPQLRKLTNHGMSVRWFPLTKAIWITPTRWGRKIIEKHIMYYWLLQNIKNLNVAVFHVNIASISEIFLKAKRRCGIPMIYTNHYVPEPEPLETLDAKEFLFYEGEKLWIKRICEHSSEVVTVSKYAKKRLKEEFGINSTVIYHGVDTNKYNPSLPNKKESLGFKPDEKIVLWVARFGNHPYKDPFTFIKAIPTVLRQYPKTKFLMVGKGSLKPYAINLAKRLSVYESIMFLDYVEHLNYVYASSDVFVFPSFNDNFGLVVAEAMACGKPVIISNRGAPREVVGDAGLTFEYGSHRDLADKIIMLLENDDLNRKIGEKAHKRIVENFTWDKAAKKYINIYENIARTRD
jgi:glycosyltransferase involved in cell wall biosynthesis